MRSTPAIRFGAVAAGVVASFVLVRWWLAPREGLHPNVRLEGTEVARVRGLLSQRIMNSERRQAWPGPAVVEISGPVAKLPYGCFMDFPFLGVASAGELFDVFVNVGALTAIAGQ